MIFHYVAVGLIAVALVWHFWAGGEQNFLRAANKLRPEGRIDLPDRILSYVWVGSIIFFGFSAVLLLTPAAPIWIKIVVGVCWVCLGVLDLIRNQAKQVGGYYNSATGVLILLGATT